MTQFDLASSAILADVGLLEDDGLDSLLLELLVLEGFLFVHLGEAPQAVRGVLGELLGEVLVADPHVLVLQQRQHRRDEHALRVQLEHLRSVLRDLFVGLLENHTPAEDFRIYN